MPKTREESEKVVDKTFHTFESDGKTFGTYEYPKCSEALVLKLENLVHSGELTQAEVDSIKIYDKYLAGGMSKEKENAIAEIREKCIIYEMVR